MNCFTSVNVCSASMCFMSELDLFKKKCYRTAECEDRNVLHCVQKRKCMMLRLCDRFMVNSAGMYVSVSSVVNP